MISKILRFSEPFVKVRYLESVRNYKIKGKTIVYNISERPIKIENTWLRPWKSSIFTNVIVASAQKLICINVKPNFIAQKSYKYAILAKKKWTHIYKLYPLAKFKKTSLWKSDIDSVGKLKFYLWFASAGTDCRIHKHPHDFLEIHTQIFGVGRMQKFYKEDRSTLYQEVFMSPGYTHEPFYNDKGNYPWHAYYADTDCIWLAVEGAPKRI
ncbi:MAG: hypothetical protein M1504_00655 [Candidatus Marsarchaeota archaeon]|nr:hypothetical protein [Candidatus Marsarchaeota archaeon]